MSLNTNIPRATRNARLRAMWKTPGDCSAAVWADEQRSPRELAADWLKAFAATIALAAVIILLGWAAFIAIKAVLS